MTEDNPFSPSIFGIDIDLSVLDADTANCLGKFVGDVLRQCVIEQDILRAQLSDHRARCYGHVDERDLLQAVAERDALAIRLKQAERVIETVVVWRAGWGPQWMEILTAAGQRKTSPILDLITAIDFYQEGRSNASKP